MKVLIVIDKPLWRQHAVVRDGAHNQTSRYVFSLCLCKAIRRKNNLYATNNRIQ